MSDFTNYYDSLMSDDNFTLRLYSTWDPDSSNNPKKQENNDYKLVLKSFIQEPLSYNITHSYTGLSVGFEGFFTTASEKFEETKKRFKESSIPFISFLNSVLNSLFSNSTIGNKLPTLDYTMRERSIFWNEYYRKFKGTEVNIPLGFNLKLFSRKDDDGKIITPYEQVKNILKFFGGQVILTDKQKNNQHYWGVGDELTNVDQNEINKEQIRIYETQLVSKEDIEKNDVKIDAESYWKSISEHGIRYVAPNGFSVDAYTNKSLRTKKNMFCLCYGKRAKLDYLLVSNVSFSFSKAMTVIENQVTPLYANISFVLNPAYTFTILDIMNIFQSDFDTSELGMDDISKEISSSSNLEKKNFVIQDNIVE